MGKKLCRHCKVKRANRARSLCWACYYKSGIRKQYPPLSPKGVHNHDFYGGHELPEPTAALPGTPEKVAVLAARVQAKVTLWNPDDATY